MFYVLPGFTIAYPSVRPGWLVITVAGRDRFIGLRGVLSHLDARALVRAPGGVCLLPRTLSLISWARGSGWGAQ